MKRTNQLKIKLKEGQSVFGAWSNIPSPNVINILSNTGMDFVVIDLEHGPVSYETLEHQIYAADCENVSPIVRLASVDENAILHALEVGGQSIIVSHVKTDDEVKTIVGSAKYYPEGERGVSLFTRNHSYSAENYEEKMKFINDQVFIGVLIEGGEGIDNIEQICRVEQLDMVYVGIYDITQYLGIPGEVRNQKVITLLTDIAQLAKSHGLAVGSVAPDQDYVRLLLESGYNFISYLPDSAVLYSYYKELTKAFRNQAGPS